MNSTLWASPSEITRSCLESSRSKNLNSFVLKPFLRIGDLSKKENSQLVSHDARKVVISSHLVPGHFEGSFMGKKCMEEPSRKLEYVRTLLIDNYDSYTYNIFQDLSIINGVPPLVVRNDEWTWEEIYHYLYEERAFDNLVISPGPGSPTCLGDIGVCLRLLLECRDIPILGVCLGHQALGYVHGVQVVHASEPVHGRLSDYSHTSGVADFFVFSLKVSHVLLLMPFLSFTVKFSIMDVRFSMVSLLEGIRGSRWFDIIHLLDAKTLPKELIPIAWTSFSDTLPFLGNQKSDVILDSNGSWLNQQTFGSSVSKDFKNGSSWPSGDAERVPSKEVLMGIKHSTRPHYGVQFHPESVATSHGKQLFENFREITEDYWHRLRSSSISWRKVHCNGAR